MKPTIGIDIDDVVVDFTNPFLDFYYQRTGRRVHYDDIHTYKLEVDLARPRNEVIGIVREFYQTEEFDNLPFIDGAKEAVNNICETLGGVFLTSRPYEGREKTIPWAKLHFPYIGSGVLFSRDFQSDRKIPKSTVCLREGLTTIIEDNRHYSLGCANVGIRTILFNRPWNKGVQHHLIARVNNWREAIWAIGD